MVEAEPTRPALRYLGGKWMLAGWISSFFPPHRIYVEPFGGAASVLLRKARAFSEVYNDLDDEVVGLFRVLRDPAAASALIRALELTPFSRTEFAGTYDLSGNAVEDARRLVARSFMGHGSNAANRHRNTGFRANSNSSGTSPARDWANFPAALALVVERLRGVLIDNRPALEVIQAYTFERTLLYVDPPYPHSTRSSKLIGGQIYNSYRYEMSDTDHADLLAALSTHPAMIILSGYANPLYDDVLRSWSRVEQTTWADGARARQEVLWINPAAVRAGALAQPHPDPPHPDLFGE